MLTTQESLYDELNLNYNRKVRELAEVREELGSVKKKLSGTQTKLCLTEGILTDIQNELTASEDELCASEDELFTVKDRLIDAEKELEDNNNKLAAELEASEKAFSRLNNQNVGLIVQIEKLKMNLRHSIIDADNVRLALYEEITNHRALKAQLRASPAGELERELEERKLWYWNESESEI